MAENDVISVTLTRAQWERTMEVLGAAKNDAIAGQIASEIHRKSPDSGRESGQ